MTMRGDKDALIAFKTEAWKQVCNYNCKGIIFFPCEKQQKFWLDVHSACRRQIEEIV